MTTWRSCYLNAILFECRLFRQRRVVHSADKTLAHAKIYANERRQGALCSLSLQRRPFVVLMSARRFAHLQGVFVAATVQFSYY